MKNVLIISGHPSLAQSVANQTILDEFEKALPNANIRKLDELYPNFQIDVQAEQNALNQADIIVWQFPFHWYSLPALMKKWLDDVFVHGFAHGSNAKLGGKKLLVSFTTGAPKSLYSPDNIMLHHIEDYGSVFESTAALCGLDYQKPMYMNGVSYVGRDDAKIAEQQQQAREYAVNVINRIKSL